MARDDFLASTNRILGSRAAFRCSNPSCQRPTLGPNSEAGTLSIGVAAHITAASENGPRYDASLDSIARKDSSNGIWLCQTCSRLIDTDAAGYSVETLREWKAIRELSAALEIRGFSIGKNRSFVN
ncbi:MAG: hypothetical protein ACRCT6_08665, partial [Notoacmeibacter sp.]